MARITELAGLVPYIVGAIMDGRERDGPTFKNLTVRPVPLSWDISGGCLALADLDRKGSTGVMMDGLCR